eukprot:7329931-Pyramimonas_sp.AAC.1
MVDHRAAWLREGQPCGSCAAGARRARGATPFSTRLIASCWPRRVDSLVESPSHLKPSFRTARTSPAAQWDPQRLQQ